MLRAKSVTFEKFLVRENDFSFEYSIDDERCVIHLIHNFQSPLYANQQRAILFNIGMCYLIDIAELVVPDTIILNFALSDMQLYFWKSLYQEVAKEKMYLYSLDLVLLDATWQTKTDAEKIASIDIPNQQYRALCLTGGKESLTLLKLLKDQDDLLLFFLNPEMNVHRQKVFDAVKSRFLTVKTISNRQDALKKIKEKFQTSLGSGVDMAHLIFNTMLLGCRYVMIGNEYSSNFPNLMYQGYMINHQYIKSIHFAQKINAYIDDCLTKDFDYYSPFFGLYELNIGSKLFEDEEFLDIWTSCNHTTAETNFCSDCAKCAFTYLLSAVYTSDEFLSKYFSRDLLQDIALFKPLQDFTGEKPLDCVGEKIEVWTALNILSERPDQKNKPVVQYFVQKIKPFIIDELPKYHKEVYAIHKNPTYLPVDLHQVIENAYGHGNGN